MILFKLALCLLLNLTHVVLTMKTFAFIVLIASLPIIAGYYWYLPFYTQTSNSLRLLSLGVFEIAAVTMVVGINNVAFSDSTVSFLLSRLS